MNNNNNEPIDKYGNKMLKVFYIFYNSSVSNKRPKLLQVYSEVLADCLELGMKQEYADKIARLFGYMAKDGTAFYRGEKKRWNAMGTLTEDEYGRRSIRIPMLATEHPENEQDPEPTFQDYAFLLAHYENKIEEYWINREFKPEDLK